MSRMEKKIEALSKFLGVTKENIVGDGNNEKYYKSKIDNSEYLVLTDKEADAMFEDNFLNLYDDIGLQMFTKNALSDIYNNYVDTEWFESYFEEYFRAYVDDIKHIAPLEERFDNRLEEEMFNSDSDDEEDFINYLVDNVDDYVREFEFEFGEEALLSTIQSQNLLDIEETIEYVKEMDGRNALADYDGLEIEQDNLFIYRIS